MGMIMMYAHETLIWKLEMSGLVQMLALFSPFFGFECPTQNEVHCQCYTRERFGDKPFETADCNALVTGDKFHCTGSAVIDGISMGWANIGSIYEVSAPCAP
jgi:hypothetical protein